MVIEIWHFYLKQIGHGLYKVTYTKNDIKMRTIIKEEMRKQGLSASKLAEKAGVRIASFTEYLAGRKELRSDNLEKIFAALNMKLSSVNEMSKKIEKDEMLWLQEKK